jgi:hypothetical protein
MDTIPDKLAIAQTLDDSPGPLPWYGRTAGSRLYSHGLELEWTYSEEIHRSLLIKRTDSGQSGAHLPVFGVAKTYTYVKSLPGDRFSLWWQERSGSAMGAIQFRVYDSAVLHEIHNWRSEGTDASENLIGAPELCTFAITSALDDGLNRVTFPSQFSCDVEILVLVNRIEDGIDICIWSIDTKSQTIFVMPQRWWNNSDADFGYQWITRVAREHISGLIVGDGIRISPFVLDASGTTRNSGH